MKKPLFVLMVLAALLLAGPALAGEEPEGEDRAPRKTFTNSIGMTFVYIPPGTFLMGSPPEEPERQNSELAHPVTLSRGFYMQTTEVTQAQWMKLTGTNPAYAQGGEDFPVEQVSWYDADRFATLMNLAEQTGAYHLPTEAQWEYACRAGTVTPFHFGTCLDLDKAPHNGRKPLPGCPEDTYSQWPVPVGSYEPNAFGLFDMHGNVREWCRDFIGPYPYPVRPLTDPTGPVTGVQKVHRGGAWIDDASECRAAYRGRSDPDWSDWFIGLRLVKEECSPSDPAPFGGNPPAFPGQGDFPAVPGPGPRPNP